MSDCPIEISVKTNFVPSQSRSDDKRYVYTYTITISNCSDDPVQLISRHWLVKDANESCQEIRGIGVVGEQPRLEPGEEYTYTSGIVLATEHGTMEGSYQLRTDDDQEINAPIPQFALVPPHALH